MLDIKFIRQNSEKVKEGVAKKQAKVDIDRLLALDEKKREYLQKIENMRAEQNKLGKDDIAKAQGLKAEIKKLEPELENTEKELQILLRQIPNLPLDTVPVGKDDSENIVLREEGKKTKFDFQPKDYMDIGEKLDIIDTQRAAKVSGTRFGYIKGGAAMLEFALVNLALETLSKDKFIPVVPPVMLKPEMMEGMGYVERGAEEIYYLERDKLYLVGTSEQSIGAMHSGETFQEKDLPKRYAGFSTCFRREAGAYGKDTKGILRVHQFDKVEMFSFCHPEKSKEEHQLLLKMEEKLMKLLELPYRVINICTGDLGDPAAAKYDIEAWLPGQGQYRETHSTSNTTDYQARRLNIRYKTKDGLEFVHMLNGTAFAIGRMLIAIIENYQQKDGTVLVPKVLQKYTGFKKIE
ncbi:MAG: serine--tRNA ligase [Candidatus Nealsonbacteria bacterium]|nr:serine--tRNA ligase [Candidatus Nealsonbacteria bacterium]